MNVFLKPEFHGNRFDGGVIPLEVLGDLAAMREMIIETAKWRYMQDHPQRQRLPAKFAEDVNLDLVGIDRGSAIPLINLSTRESDSSGITGLAGMLPGAAGYFEEGRDAIIRAIAAAGSGGDVLEHISQWPLRYFSRIGRYLRADESILFGRPDGSRTGRLNHDSRQRLLDASRVISSEQVVTIRGTIPEADQDRNRFEVLLPNGRKVIGKIGEGYLDTILGVFNGFSTDSKVLIRGTVKYDRYQRPTRLETIDEVIPLHPLDVTARLDELRELKDGWLDGEGLAPDSDGLDWLAESFDRMYSNDAPLPRLYPMPEGGVQAEWFIGQYDASLEIDLATRMAEWHNLNFDTDASVERVLNLSEPRDWEWLSNEARALESSAT